MEGFGKISVDVPKPGGGSVRPLLLRYVNRASDLLWLLARRAEA